MKKLLLCATAVLCVAASIFGGYYFYVTNDLQETAVQQGQLQKEDMPKPTDTSMPFKQRGGALMDEEGEIDPSGIANAIAQRDLYLAQHMPPDGFGDKGDRPAPQVPNNWLPRGPQNVSGRIEDILLHPEFGSGNSKTMWAGAASGGIWFSNDGGESWNAANGVIQNFNVSCLVVEPGDPIVDGPMTLYAGTGALDLHGGGVFRSIDGGMNWERLRDTNLWRNVSSIAVARDDNGDTIILAAMEGSDLGQSPDHGIMRYNARLNTPWTMVIDASYGTSVGFDPNDRSRATAAVCYRSDPDVDPDGKCKAFYSDDYGLTWAESRLGETATPNPSPTPGLFETAREDHQIFFFFRTSATGPTTIYAQNGTGLNQQTILSKSMDGGINFSKHNMTGPSDGISSNFHPLWVSPEVNPPPTPNFITVLSGAAPLYRSNNNAQSFEPQPIADGYIIPYNPVNPHVDFTTVVTDPRGGTNKKVFVATDGGIYHTEDITTATGIYAPGGTPMVTPSGWTALNNRLQNTQYFAVAGDASSGTTIIVGGTQDNGTLRQVGTNTNTVNIIGGDGGASAVDGTYCFGRNTGGQYFRVNDCITASHNPPDHHEITNTCYVPDQVHGDEFMIDTDPQNSNDDHKRAFLGARSVWRTANVKTPIPDPILGAVPVWFRIKENSNVTQVIAMALAPSNSNYMWVAETLTAALGEIYTDPQTH